MATHGLRRNPLVSSLEVVFHSQDEYGIVAGHGYVLVEKSSGNRIDWPMMATYTEAIKTRNRFCRMERELARDEISEATGLAMMAGELG